MISIVLSQVLPSLGRYLTEPCGNVNLSQLDVILGKVGEIEDEIFRRRKGAEEAEEARRGGATPICKQYRSRGICVRGAACRFLHDAPIGGATVGSETSVLPVTETVTASAFADARVPDSENVSAATKLKEMMQKKRKTEDTGEKVDEMGEKTSESGIMFIHFFLSTCFKYVLY